MSGLGGLSAAWSIFDAIFTGCDVKISVKTSLANVLMFASLGVVLDGRVFALDVG